MRSVRRTDVRYSVGAVPGNRWLRVFRYADRQGPLRLVRPRYSLAHAGFEPLQGMISNDSSRSFPFSVRLKNRCFLDHLNQICDEPRGRCPINDIMVDIEGNASEGPSYHLPMDPVDAFDGAPDPD
jgi:hypothetical protein